MSKTFAYDRSRTAIIAEAGVNHNGRLDLAMKLVDAAAEAGADAVKFQTFKTENMVCRHAEKAAYQQETTAGEESQFEMLKRLELGNDDFRELANYCKKRQIIFLSTPFDLESAEMLNKMQDIFKIPSGEITNLPLLRKIASFGKEIILSTGMSYMAEVKDAVRVLLKNGIPAGKITVLHCNTEYPTPMADVNLRAMQTMAETLGLAVGYSDHTLGIEVSIAAVALG
ncbi:MAG: N-acetylneuraminate synthase, partial [Deltaproteobacteria bacterium]|nr:N-acetylneuraminate synthase [Deltaproteobacteria bacterium]